MASTFRIILIATGLCLAYSCQSSIERVRGALTSAPDWYTNKRDEIAGEGYPALICRANELETFASFQQESIFEEALLEKRIGFLEKFSELIKETDHNNKLVEAKTLLTSLENQPEESIIWTEDELNDLTELLDSLPDPS